MMTWMSARWKARSVPGLMGSHSVALAAVFVKRGSRTTTLAPRAIADTASCDSELEMQSSMLRPV